MFILILNQYEYINIIYILKYNILFRLVISRYNRDKLMDFKKAYNFNNFISI